MVRSVVWRLAVRNVSHRVLGLTLFRESEKVYIFLLAWSILQHFVAFRAHCRAIEAFEQCDALSKFFGAALTHFERRLGVFRVVFVLSIAKRDPSGKWVHLTMSAHKRELQPSRRDYSTPFVAGRRSVLTLSVIFTFFNPFNLFALTIVFSPFFCQIQILLLLLFLSAFCRGLFFFCLTSFFSCWVDDSTANFFLSVAWFLCLFPIKSSAGSRIALIPVAGIRF